MWSNEYLNASHIDTKGMCQVLTGDVLNISFFFCTLYTGLILRLYPISVESFKRDLRPPTSNYTFDSKGDVHW